MGSYKTTMSLKEVLYFFFRKKKCPICGKTMRREKRMESLGKGHEFSATLGMGYYGDRYRVHIYYKCENCNKYFSLSELALS